MKILVASDGSEHALRAVKYAAELTRLLRTQDRLTLVSVHDDAGLRHARTLLGKALIDDYLRELSEKDLKPASDVLKAADIDYDMDIRTGHVAQEIVRCADEGKFDLIVLGSKGRSAMTDLLVGSVAQRVLATSSQPVVVVK
ncbi:MAG: universal stress protein [Burkholderiaceae bacterium]